MTGVQTCALPIFSPSLPLSLSTSLPLFLPPPLSHTFSPPSQSEKAVTDKAIARALRCDTVPFIRHALLRASARAALAGPPLVALAADPWNEPDSDAEEEANGRRCL